MTRQLTEDLPSIAIAALRDRSDPDALHDVGVRLVLEVGGNVLITHALAGEPTAQSVKLASVVLKFGSRLHFVCPLSGRRSSRLYFKDGLFASRQGHGLAYRSQRLAPDERLAARAQRIAERIQGDGLVGAARGGRREALLDELRSVTRKLTALGETPTELIAILDREDERRIARRRRLRPRPSDSPMLTRSALHAGRTHHGGASSTIIQATVDRRMAGYVPEASAPLDLPPSPLEVHPQLDIRRLKPASGYARGHRMIWPWSGQGVGLHVLARLAEAGDGSRRLDLWIDDHVVGISKAQRISLTVSPVRRETMMICPALGTRHRKLFYRAGSFASAGAQRLQRGR